MQTNFKYSPWMLLGLLLLSVASGCGDADAPNAAAQAKWAEYLNRDEPAGRGVAATNTATGVWSPNTAPQPARTPAPGSPTVLPTSSGAWAPGSSTTVAPNDGSGEVFNSPLGRFSIRVPSGAQRVNLDRLLRQARTAATPANIRSDAWQLGERYYAVVYVDVPRLGSVPPDKYDSLFDGGRDGMAKSMPMQVTGETNIQLQDKYRGREVQGINTAHSLQVFARFFVVGDRLYQLMAAEPSQSANAENAKRFLDSFALQ